MQINPLTVTTSSEGGDSMHSCPRGRNNNARSSVRFAARLLLSASISLYVAEPLAAAETAASEVADSLRASAATPAAVEYRPSMPDMMNIGVQPRHLKLGLAGRERNWTYSAYEVRELRSAFTRIARTAPSHDGWDTQAMFNKMIMTPIQNVEDAIKAGNGRAFDANYAALTEACNACHVVMGRGYIVIQVPHANAYPNQVFHAPR